jgi:hypothetical protein
MTTDRELLELAARAAGNGARWSSDDPFMLRAMMLSGGVPWSPLTDDGDALRLAVMLGMEMKCHLGVVDVWSAGEKFSETFDFTDKGGYAATRRCIVRAAAAIIKER